MYSYPPTVLAWSQRAARVRLSPQEPRGGHGSLPAATNQPDDGRLLTWLFIVA